MTHLQCPHSSSSFSSFHYSTIYLKLILLPSALLPAESFAISATLSALRATPATAVTPDSNYTAKTTYPPSLSNPQNYNVKAIDYQNYTIRLADASLKNHDICSFPIHSIYPFTLTHYNPYQSPISPTYPYDYKATFINLINCPNPLNNSSTFTNITPHFSSFNGGYPYVKVGRMNASDIPPPVPTGSDSNDVFRELNNIVSLSEIHTSLLYGFELAFCTVCPVTLSSTPTAWWCKNLDNIIVF